MRGVGLLHVADVLGDPRMTLIPATTMCRAIELGEYLLAHAERALTPVSIDPLILDAEHILAWIRNTSSSGFSKRDLHNALRRNSRFEKAEELDPVLKLLEKHHWIIPCERQHVGRPGRPPSPTYRVHPSTHNPQNPQK